MEFDGTKLKILIEVHAKNNGHTPKYIRKKILDDLDISKSVLSQWEHGKFNPSTEHIIKLQKFFGGLDAGYFLKKTK